MDSKFARKNSHSQYESDTNFLTTARETDSSASYNGGQSLASILNNPSLGKSGVYSTESSWWWSLNYSASVETVPIAVSRTFPEITRSDFQPYIDAVSDSHARFEDVREHSERELQERRDRQGDVSSNALATCLREIPSLYFREDFALEEGATFQSACPFSSIPENVQLQEKLSYYLDIVEVQLVKEISLRSDSFFEAQGKLQDLNQNLAATYERLLELKDRVKLMDSNLVQNASEIQELSRNRAGLIALQEKLKLVSYVHQSLSTLKLLIQAADCASALDVIDDLQRLQQRNDLVGLHCFRQLGNQLSSSLEDVNSILAADFVRTGINDAKEIVSHILSVWRTREKDLVSILMDDSSMEIKLIEERSSGLQDRLLPLVIGLLRTAKLPSILRVYRDTLIADIKASIKTAVAELLPTLLINPPDSDLPAGERQADLDAGRFSMASKLRSLSSQSFVQLLTAIFRVVQIHLLQAAEVRKVVEWIIGGLDGSYAADAVAAAFASGAAVAAAAEAAQEGDLLSGPYPVSSQHSGAYGSLPLVNINEAASPSTVSKNFRADVLRENTEAVFAACDAAHARWAKLLGVRALVHPKLRLQDFLSLYNITHDFLSATEKIGGRLGYSIRGSLQSQTKSFIDYQHNSRVTKIGAILDQETWVAIDVPDEFQTIVESFTFTESSAIEGNHAFTDLEVVETINNNSEAVIVDSSGLGNESVDFSNNSTNSKVAESLSNDATSRDIGSKVKKGHEKPTAKTLDFKGVRYHMVNCGIILLKMLSEYVNMANALSNFASDVLHRVADILKLFNTRTCQLVLGAGAMQVSGLKSITAKHLALASQTIGFFYSLIPDIERIILIHVSEAHKAVLLSEIHKIRLDYKVHRDEIHQKLVQIMKERLVAHLRALPQLAAESWSKTEDNDSQPSSFARNLTKEVGVLQRVISPILHETDVQAIFRQVAQNFHNQISDALAKIDISTPQAKQRLYKDMEHIITCIRSMPTNYFSQDGIPNPGNLDKLLTKMVAKDAD